MSREKPGRGAVRLAFVRLASTAERPGPPIVFLSGGPGLSGIRMGRGRLFGLFDALRAAGDVILLDQRGSGASSPSLECENLIIPFERAWSKDGALRAVVDWSRRCAERLGRAGVDLSAFNTNESADDIAELARALGAGTVSLLGWSYGTHLAFAVLRRHEGLVARAVLAGPEGPDHTYKLPSRIQRQLESIGERARAAMPHAPDLLATMRDVLASLDRKPAQTAIGRFDLEWMTAEGVADTRVLARLPRWYGRMARGDFGDIARDPLLRSYLEGLRGGLGGSIVRACMDCASGASAQRLRRIEEEARSTLLGRTIDFPFPEVCDAVGRPDLGDAFRAPLRSSAEVLFVTGTLDARTPSDNVTDLAPGFPRARHLIVEDAGHADLLHPSSVQRAIVHYFARGELEEEHARMDTPFRFEPLEPVLIYDGECAFCRTQVDRLRRRVSDAISFEPYQETRVQIPKDDLARAIHFIDEEGNVYAGAAAVLRARASGRRSAMWWMYRHVPGFAAVAELGYRWVARHRGGIVRKLTRS